MSVKVRCTGCEKVLTAPDSARGKSIRCPTCETKVRVPEAKEKPAKKQVKADSEDALASLDLRNLEDRDARICAKCGYDMQHQDEDETECPKCGYDSESGGLGAKAQKKRMKGPDPDKFFEGLWKPNWKFVKKNQALAWRTMAYTLVASLLMFFCLFMYLYIPLWPPRIFFAMCAFISGVMLPGWLWFMDQELILASLQKKDKLKRINFDFFLCSALGVKFLAWNVVFALPIVALPALIGYVMTEFGGLPPAAFWVCVGVGYLPVLAMMPICMGHFVMPVQAPGWMFWKVVPAWFRAIKPTVVWVLLTLALHAPAIGCVGAAIAIYAPQIGTVVAQMEENAEIYRTKLAKENAGSKAATAFADNPLVDKPYHEPAYSVFIVPGVLWLLACVLLGFPAMYVCRVNGQFIYFFRESLDLIFLAKEYKYVAKQQTDEDEEAKPKTIAQIATEAIVTTLICVTIGAVGGMLFAAFGDNVNTVVSMLVGAYYGASLASLVGKIMLVTTAFKESVGWGLVALFVPFGELIYASKHWQDAAPGCLTMLSATVVAIFILILALAGLFSLASLGIGGADPNANQPAQMQPVDDAMPAADPMGAPDAA